MLAIYELLKNKYIQIVLVFILALGLGYYKGYTDKSEAVLVDQLKEFKLVTEKLDKVYNFSVDKSKESKEYIKLTDSKLKAILVKVNKKQVPLTSVPCTPSEEFSKKWEELNNAVIK